ncbi:unnamed protein product [Oikopleura dioica]|uniref:Uncharacterized protein n=1 Tax=Oikopleura dioica TaxID=34765 RepID=E4XGW5_OIKDI|nr:unnamed protein product [Oikopleura dioica]
MLYILSVLILGSASFQQNGESKIENIERTKLCECSFYYLSYYEQKTEEEELILKKNLCEEICLSLEKTDCSRDILRRIKVILDCDDGDNDPSESLLKAFRCRFPSLKHYIDLS